MSVGIGTAWRRRAAGWAAAACCALASGGAEAQFISDKVPEQARGLEITERLGQTVPLGLDLVDSTGRAVKLGDSFNRGRPVVLALVYYDCPVACPTVLKAMTRCFNGLKYEIGKDFDVVVVSFDPTNTPLMAAKAKAETLMDYSRPQTEQVKAGWGFYTAKEEASRALADAVGFGYRLVPASNEYSHAIGIFVLTPAGKVSRYFYSFEYPPQDMKLALIEASEGKIVKTIGERLLQLCYHYNPKTGTYTFAAYRLMQAGAILTMVLLAVTVALLKATEARRGGGASRRTAPAFPVASLDAAVGRLGPAAGKLGPPVGRQG